MPRRLSWRSGLSSWILLGCLSTGVAMAQGQGVVIEKVGSDSTLERAGLQIGDHVLAWERLPAPPANPQGEQGQIESYFDWWWLVHEQAPRGTVRLTAERGGLETVIEVTPGLWKVARVRPWLPDSLLAPYREGQAFETAGEVERSVALWQKLAQDAPAGEVRCWMWLRIGLTWVQVRQWDKAQEAFSMALEVADDELSRGVLQYNQGHTYFAAQRYGLAQQALMRAEETWNTHFGKSLALALVLERLSMVTYRRNDTELAESYFQTTLDILQELAPKSLALAQHFRNLGVVAIHRSQLDLAEHYYRVSLEITQELEPTSLETAKSFNSLGSLAQERGDLNLAQRYYQSSLQIGRQLAPKSREVAKSWNNLAHVMQQRGDLQLATSYLQRSIEIKQWSQDPIGLAAGFHNLGVLAQHRGDLDLAKDYYQRSVEIKQTLEPDSLWMARSLYGLGDVANGLGDLTTARDYYQRSLKIFQQLAPQSLMLAMNLSSLGRAASDEGSLDQAESYYQRALDMRERLAPRSLSVAFTFKDLGDVALERGDLSRAEHLYQQALTIRRELAPGSSIEADTLHALAILRRQQGRPHDALHFFDQALTSLETQLDRLGGSRGRQAAFRAGAAKFYRNFLEVSLELGQPEEAFHVLERFRARTFLQQLTERDTVFNADVPDELDRRRRTLAVRIDRTQGRLDGLNPRDHAEQIEDIQTQLQQLRQQSEQLEQEILAASPRLAALQYPQPLNIEAARKALDSGTLLLAFSLGQESTHVFAISRGEKLHVETLPIGENELRRKVEGFRQALETTPAGSPRMASLEARARSLYDTLLAPLSDRIDTAQRLLILPEGPLYYLPWAALRSSTGRTTKRSTGRSTGDSQQYLIEHLPIHIAVSATVYAELQQARRAETAAKWQATTARVVGFGDPDYPSSADAAQRYQDVAVRSAGERGIFDWRSLPHTRREIQGLAALYPQSSSAYLGPRATEEQAKALGRDVRIVHFATHGHIDDRFPMNSFLALAIPEQPKEGQDNGLLQVWEIYENLRLDADLVVLSACESGLGEELRGEGLMGLTRAFHYAGARSVLSTLWSIDDDATAELMLRFHRQLVRGISKDEALRAAQLESMEVTAPRAWAAFQLYGDWQ